MHEKAAKNIRTKIKSLLEACEVNLFSPILESASPELMPLITEILKHKSEWMNNIDVYLLIMFEISSALEEKKQGGLPHSGPMKDALTKDEIEKLTSSIFETIVSVPLKYTAYLELKDTGNEQLKPLKLSDCAQIIKINGNDLVSQLRGSHVTSIFSIKIIDESYYLALEVSGFAKYWIGNPTTARTLSQIKTIIQMGLNEKVFKQTKDNIRASLGITPSKDHITPKSMIKFRDQSTGEISELELGIEISRALNGISYDWVQNLEADLGDDSDKNIIAQNLLSQPAKLSESTHSEAAKIRSAVEWLFDSHSTTNTPMSLLQACIGLEAALGDKEGSDSITDILADRCAYIVSDSIQERPKVKKIFKEIYKTRSKIVHGVINQLSDDNKHHAIAAKELLEKVIKNELAHLKL